MNIEGLPTKAGLAVLEYSTSLSQPKRNGDTITLPAQSCACQCGKPLRINAQPQWPWEFCPHCGIRLDRAAVKFVPLGKLIPLKDDFEQFLCIGPPDRENSIANTVWFGGTDERPFLVRMDSWTQDALRHGDFYGYIIPSTMLTMARKWGNTWKRQGDIFAYPLPFSWDDLKEIGNFTKAKGIQIQTGVFSPFGTRHEFTGLWTTMMVSGLVRPIVEGEITAPDHSPLALDGPHVLTQTAHLYSPVTAD